MRVALLNVSHLPEDAETNFRRAFSPLADINLINYDVRNLTLPDPEAVDAAVITGSIDSVNDNREYVHAIRKWVQSVDIPIFGVCFGHQLIATAFGGAVAHMPDRELGYRRITLDRSEDPVFDGIPADPIVFLCHEDIVTTPPPTATVLASNEYGIQAFRLGQMIAVQFHPEADIDYAQRLFTELDLPDETRRDAIETITEENATMARQSRRLFENFVREFFE